MTTVVVYPRAEVSVDGNGVTPMSVEATLSLRSPVSVLNVAVTPDTGEFTGREQVEASLGDQSGVRRQFSGRLNVDSVQYGPKQTSFSAQGILFLTQEATGTVDDTAAPADTDPEAPPYQGPTFAKKWIEQTDGQIITDILHAYGITDIDIADSENVFGSIEPVRWRSDQPGWALIEELDTITGYRTFDGPDGIVTRIEYSGLPGATAAYQLTEGINIRHIERQRTTGKVYNVVVVKGKSGIQTPAGDYYDISASRTARSPYVPSPPGTRQYTFSSELIETEELAGECAGRLLANLNRRTENITLTVTPGNRYLRPGMTIGVDAPSVNLDSATRSRILEVRQVFGSDYNTQLVLEGALAGEGVDPNARPIAMISYIIEVENTASGSVWIVLLDGSASYDPDGSIVDYLWSSTAGTITVVGDGKTATLLITGGWPNPDPVVTLTVTDNNGKLGTKKISIARKPRSMYTRDIWAAVTTDLLYSNDGQITWTPFGIPASYIPEEAGDNYQLAASAAGHLYRALSDGTYTEPTIGSPVRSLFITRDRNGKETKAAWAGGADGKVWRSPDRGVTWFLAGTIAVGVPIFAITESPYSSGDLYATCGRTIVHSYDAGGHWTVLYTHPNTGVEARRFASGISEANVQTHWAAFYGPTMDADASHVIEAKDNTSLDTDVPANKPLRFTGLTISLDAERLLLTDVSIAGVGRAWAGPATVSGNLTQKTAYNPATYGVPAHIIRDGKFPVVWGISDNQIWKSPTEFDSFLTVKTLDSGQIGSMIGYGKLNHLGITPGALVLSAIQGSYVDRVGGTAAILRYFNGTWTKLCNHPIPDTEKLNMAQGQGLVNYGADIVANVSFSSYSIERPLRRDAAGNLYTYAYLRFGDTHISISPNYANLWKSTDSGETWTQIIGITGVRCIDVDANGGLWAITNDGQAIAWSGDAGASWSTIVNDTPHGLNASAPYYGIWPFDDRWTAIACDATDPGKIIALSPEGYSDTSDGFGLIGGGVTVWTPLTDYSIYAGGRGVVRAPGLAATLAGRFTGGSEGTRIFWKPDTTATQTEVFVTQGYETEFERLAGNVVALSPLSSNNGVYWSDATGQTWNVLMAAAALPLHGSDLQTNAVAAAQSADASYIYIALAQATSSAPGSNAIQTVVALNSDGEWTDISANMIDQIGAQYVAYMKGMVCVDE